MALEQSNDHVILAQSAARTATANFAAPRNLYHRGVTVVIDVTAAADTPSVVFTVQGRDPTSGKYYALLASAAVTEAGTTRLTVYPGITAATNAAASLPLPLEWRVNATAADADSLTYSVSALLHL